MFCTDKVPDHLGHLILDEDGAVLSSAGELENNEQMAGIIYNMLTLTDKIDSEPYHSISIIYDEGHGYVVTMSNKKIYIVKRKFMPPSFQEVSNSQEDSINNSNLNDSTGEE